MVAEDKQTQPFPYLPAYDLCGCWLEHSVSFQALQRLVSSPEVGVWMKADRYGYSLARRVWVLVTCSDGAYVYDDLSRSVLIYLEE